MKVVDLFEKAEETKKNVILLIGKPGSGKGTLIKKAKLKHVISTGDLVRKNKKKFDKYLEKGELVPDSVIEGLLMEALSNETGDTVILDGFPRTLEQAKFIEKHAIVKGIIQLKIGDKEVIKRITGRRIHEPSGRTYHVDFDPPKEEGKDDVTGEDLVTRTDDTEEAVKNRLEVYKHQTLPVIDYFKDVKKIALDSSKDLSDKDLKEVIALVKE
jgi:adenylate kinase